MTVKIDRKLYCFWGGRLNSTRKKAIESFKNNSGVDLCIITNENLHEIAVKDYPLHKNFNNLTDVFKSDYVRAYIAYHYGGGYSDVKLCQFDWNLYFDLLERSSADFIACPLINEHGTPWHLTEIPNVHNVEQGEFYGKHNFAKYPSTAQFIFKPKTHIAKLWLDEVNNVLDINSARLSKYKNIHSYIVPKNYPILGMELPTKLYTVIHRHNFEKFLLEMPQHERSNGKHRGIWDEKTKMYL